MTNEEAINHLTDMYKYSGLVGLDREDRIALSKGIEALEQEPCEDCVSRQAVEDAIYDYSRACDVNEQQIMEYIDKLPSIQHKAKVGKWKPMDLTYGRSIYYCTACMKSEDVPTVMGKPSFNYCSNCGAKMEREEEVEE